MLDALVHKAEAGEPTYPEVGATRAPTLPPGYRHDRYERVLGHSPDTLAVATAGLRAWAAHRGAGVQVEPVDAPLQVGTSVVLLLPLGLVRGVAACRVIYVIDEPDRFGFAYGTLPGHPERGEEAFIVRRGGAGAVVFEITAFSRPAELLSRLGSPVARRIQTRVTGRYLTALAEFIERSPGR